MKCPHKHAGHFVKDRLRHGQADAAGKGPLQKLMRLASPVDQPGDKNIRIDGYLEHSAAASFLLAAHFIHQPRDILFPDAFCPRPRLGSFRKPRASRWLARYLPTASSITSTGSRFCSRAASCTLVQKIVAYQRFWAGDHGNPIFSPHGSS